MHEEQKLLKQYIAHLQRQGGKTVMEARICSSQVTFRGYRNTASGCIMAMVRYKSIINCHVIWFGKIYRLDYWAMSRKWRDANAYAYLAVTRIGNYREFYGRQDVIKLPDYYVVRL